MIRPGCSDETAHPKPLACLDARISDREQPADTERRWIGAYYVGTILAALLAILHFSVVALALSLVLWVRLGRRGPAAGPCSELTLSHCRWLRRTVAVPLALYGGLAALLAFEAANMVGGHDAGHILQAVVSHVVLHSVVTLLSGLWLVVRLLLGGLRFIEGRAA
ncbi:MAG: hypothetical protein VR70_12295 [Rhodospirillaceae bacterium BRH_c57]|nr:MAG: hypothetical protein VR70_12295 [Rhodospirillaceae bacterium BRH_c57]